MGCTPDALPKLTPEAPQRHVAKSETRTCSTAALELPRASRTTSTRHAQQAHEYGLCLSLCTYFAFMAMSQSLTQPILGAPNQKGEVAGAGHIKAQFALST